ncbi:MAG: efflux RND transporter permease subunit [Pseudomonadota bacterium]|nr:efflux RND transporter permease subunit [Pseudomonadota bacterium]MDO7710068.1 efflux RND transporter permease subunit [Pseudomonadota bacterium]
MITRPIYHGKLLTVIVLIIIVLGIVAASRIPVQMIPDLDVRTISVVTGWPGATPQDIEKEILLEQERYLSSVPNLARMKSVAESSQARVELEFSSGIDINETLIEVTNALSQVSNYPENVNQPRIISSSFSENAFMYYAVTPLSGNPFNLDMQMVTDFIDDEVRPLMERVPGVSNVDLRGGAERQIQIHIDPEKLAYRGLSLSDVRNAIRARNHDTSAGDLNEGKRRYLIRTTGRFKDLDGLKRLILIHQNDTYIRLEDVAEVKLDHYEIWGISVVNNERALSLAVRRESGSNVINIKKAMTQVVDEIRRNELEPNGLTINLIGDDVRYVQASIDNVTRNLILGGLLATLILFLFLRSGRATLIGLIGMPICTIAAFIGLLAFDRTINVISMAGIAFAIGMTVDNTIVVLESIEQARRRGLQRFEAAISGIKDVWTAVLASSLTTVLVFAPVLFVTEEAGQLYSDIAIAVSTAIIASMLFAVAVVPAASAHFGLNTQQNTKSSKSSLFLLNIIHYLNASSITRLASIALIPILTLGIAWHYLPAAEYLPEGEEPKAFSRMIAPPGYNFDEMKKIGDEITGKLVKALHADPVEFDQGNIQIPSLKYYFQRIGPGYVWVMAEPTRPQDIEPMMQAFTHLFRSYPGMRAFSSRGSIISSNDGGSRAVNLDIAGANQAELYQTTQHVLLKAQQMFSEAQITSDPNTLSLDQPLIEVHPRWERLAELGIDADEFGYTVAALSDGAYVDEFFLDDDKVDIFLFSNAGQNQTLSQLATQPVSTPIGTVLPLNALADIIETVDSDELRRIDGRRTVTLSIIPPRGIALETAVQMVRDEMIPAMRADGEVGKGVSISISGAADQLDATRDSLSSNFLIALILIYLLLVAIFKHWFYPFLILATIPLGIAGGILGLVGVNASAVLIASIGFNPIVQPFDMITMLGFIILLGTVVNNPILIVEQARRNLANDANTIRDAVNQAVATRLRPILMSTATTICGLAPLVFIPGAGTELYRGVGIVVLSGLFFSTLVTLFFLPSLMITVLTLLRKNTKISHVTKL